MTYAGECHDSGVIRVYQYEQKGGDQEVRVSQNQMLLPLEGLNDWLNEGRRPKKITWRLWCYIRMLISVKGHIPYRDSAYVEDLYEKTYYRLSSIMEINEVQATQWVWQWEILRPDILREIEEERQKREYEKTKL